MEGFERMSTEVNANVIKRNGVEVIFDKAKIINAVEKANEEVSKLHRLSHYQITALADMIATRALESSHAVNVEGSIPPGVFVNIVHSCGAKSYKACYWSSSNCFIVYGKISHTE